MVATTFDSILTRGVRAGQIPARTNSARSWFRNEAAKTSVTPSALMKQDRTQLKNAAMIGKMYLFSYDP